MKSTERDELIKTVQNNLQSYGINNKSLVLAAVSGGLDSTALLNILKIISIKMTFRLEAVYIDHGIRSETENRLDELSVLRNCHFLSVPFHIFRISPGMISDNADSSGQSIEESARSSRYSLFEQLLDNRNAVCLCTGHHADDQAETVLMRFLEGRGSVKGLKGIPSKRDRYFRPLLHIERSQLEAIMNSSSLLWHEDASNSDLAIKRNSLRKKWLPLLQEDFPQIKKTLLHWSEYFDEINSLFEKSLNAKIVWRHSGGNLWCSQGADFNSLSYLEKKFFLLSMFNRLQKQNSRSNKRVPDRFFREIERHSLKDWTHRSLEGTFAKKDDILYFKQNSGVPCGVSHLLIPGQKYEYNGICFSLSGQYNEKYQSNHLIGSVGSSYVLRRKLPGDSVTRGNRVVPLIEYLKSEGLLDVEFEDILLVCSNSEIIVILSQRSGPLFPAGEYGTESIYLSWNISKNPEDVYAE